MTPNQKNILDTLNLLALLFRANKQKMPKFSEEERHTLTVTEEHLSKADITIPVFLNTLTSLGDKGYLIAVGIHENEYHDKIREAFSDNVYEQVLKETSEGGLEKLSDEQKLEIATAFKKMAPKNVDIDVNYFVEEEITIKDILDDTRNAFKDHKNGVVAKVLLMPFRDINRLLKHMNEGKTFEEVLDSDIWYDDKNYLFFMGKKSISTAYNSKPNIEHSVLSLIQDSLEDGVVWYDDINDRNPRSLKDALLKFVEKDERLKQIFKVHSDRLEFTIEPFV